MLLGNAVAASAWFTVWWCLVLAPSGCSTMGIDIICPPAVWERHRRVAMDASALVVLGRVERLDGAVSLLAVRLRRLRVVAAHVRVWLFGKDPGDGPGGTVQETSDPGDPPPPSAESQESAPGLADGGRPVLRLFAG